MSLGRSESPTAEEENRRCAGRDPWRPDGLIHFHPHLHGLITDGAFAPDGAFLPLPINLTHEPFLRLWEQKVFDLLLDEDGEAIAKMRWRRLPR